MPRKILFFTESLAYGGDDTVLIQLIRHWPAAQDELTVALNAAHPGLETYRSKVGPRARISTVPERTVAEVKTKIAAASSSPWKRRVRTLSFQISRLWSALPTALRLKRFIKENKPDVILVSSGGYPTSPLTWRMVCAAWLAGIPRRILIIHSYPENISGLRQWLIFPRRRLAPFLVHRIVSVSKDCARALSVYMRPFQPMCIYNGIEEPAPNTDMPEKLRALGDRGRPLIGAIGNLEERKGFHVLIPAMKRVVEQIPGAQAVIIGTPRDKEYRDRLLEMIDSQNLEPNVHLQGFLPDAGKYLYCFDVCAMPSIAIESFGLAALEAMSCGIPIVSTRVGAIPEVVEEGKTGLLVPPNDPGQLAEAILKILREPAYAKQLAAAGKERFNALFTADRMAREYYQLTI